MQVTNEMGVVVVFAEQCQQHGFNFVSIQAAYPDAVIERNGICYRHWGPGGSVVSHLGPDYRPNISY